MLNDALDLVVMLFHQRFLISNIFYINYIMNAYLVEFLGTMFFLYVILATGNAIAISAYF